MLFETVGVGKMSAGLIGYTGFVGATIARQHSFDSLYNSRNIQEIAGKKFDLLVCAGAPGAKWLANKEPERDRASLEALQSNLSRCKADRLLLISTIDVYPAPEKVDEYSDINIEALQPYGRNRLLLEQFIASQFKNSFIVRLPALFGLGLKKNFIFDMLNNNCLDWTHFESLFQFYDLGRIWTDCQLQLDAGLPKANYATAPVMCAEVARKCFGASFANKTEKPPVQYDMHTCHATVFGGKGKYIADSEAVLNGLSEFVKSERIRNKGAP
jgi:hypothetical protein